jgi:hypothetical protein
MRCRRPWNSALGDEHVADHPVAGRVAALEAGIVAALHHQVDADLIGLALVLAREGRDALHLGPEIDGLRLKSSQRWIA